MNSRASICRRTMHRLAPWLVIASLVLAGVVQAQPVNGFGSIIEIEDGWTATVFVRGVSRIKVDDNAVATATLRERGNTQVYGRTPGRTRLWVWTGAGAPLAYDIRVLPTGSKSNRLIGISDGELATHIAPSVVPSADGAASTEPPMDLFVGSVSTLQLGEISRIVVGNDNIVEASVLDDGSLLVLGKAQGASELRVLTAGGASHDYSVRVYAAPPNDTLNLVRSTLDAFPDVRVQSKLGRILLTGTVDAASFQRFGELTERFPNVISTVTSQLNIAIEPSVVLDVSVLEINRNYQRTVGVRWQDTAAGPAVGIVGNFLPHSRVGAVSDFGDQTEKLEGLLSLVGSGTQRLSGYLGITSIIGSELQLLQEEGHARVLAAPSLSTVSGEEATFLAGGDFPVAILNEFGQPVVEFREFGVQLKIQPFVDRSLNIRSKITAEVSSIDFSVQVNGVPGLLRRKTTSTITARPGETVILSGLLDARDTRNADKVPGLANLPIIGQLFRSDDFIKQRTELVVTVTPRVQQPNAPVAEGLRAADRYLRKDLLTGSKDLDKALIQ
ncbi:type II and III secretion system protein family protein [Panacagrimonas perspica]|nr:pilus assembly protein N-terminal domain-containing protein [Panacagrimonas perspica]